MANYDQPLLEELYAPDQYKVLVTCIFLNKTTARRAARPLAEFLMEYPSAEALSVTSPEDVASRTAYIESRYLQTLGLQKSRSKRLVKLASQLLSDPPQPHVERTKTYKRTKNYAKVCAPSEVAHLTGVGQYGSDAWRLFCKKQFYLDHGEVVKDEWETLEPEDKALKAYVERKRQEAKKERETKKKPVASSGTDDIVRSMGSMHLSKSAKIKNRTPSLDGVIIRSGEHAMLIPRRMLEEAEVLSQRRLHGSLSASVSHRV